MFKHMSLTSATALVVLMLGLWAGLSDVNGMRFSPPMRMAASARKTPITLNTTRL